MTEDLPARIQHYVLLLRRCGAAANVTEDEPGKWTMTVDPGDLPEGDALGAFFTRRPNGKLRTDFELVIDGEKQDAKSLMEAILRLGQRAGTSGTSAVTSAASASRSNSVETRRASVIRV